MPENAFALLRVGSAVGLVNAVRSIMYNVVQPLNALVPMLDKPEGSDVSPRLVQSEVGAVLERIGTNARQA